MKKILKIIFYIIPFLSIIVIFNTESFVLFGKAAYYILVGMMYSRPLRDIFPKKLKRLDKIVRVRKELGIIVGVFAIAHVIGFFLASGSSYTLLLNPDIWRWNNFIAWGFVAVFVNIPLLLTSNLFSIVKLGKYWKKLQYLAYIMFLATIMHVAFINDDWLILTIIIGVTYLLIFLTAWFLNRKRSKESTSVRYLCVPCGWIYDESLGDPDSGVKPGTKFEDIPNSWVCPVCGVGKKDFIKISGEIKIEYIKAKVSKLTYINEKNDVIELVINTDKKIEPIKGQFMTFEFENEQGKFSRSYSISEINGNSLHFLIKILENGKASNIFKKLNIGDDLTVRGPFGDFLLKQNDLNKIFIATGTGLAPIYNMLLGLDSKSKKTLLFGVQTKQDLFYVDKLKNIENLKVEIFLSKEQEVQENHGNILYFNSRISLESLKDFDKNTEFYICGNLAMVSSTYEELRKYGFSNIYFEKFNS